MNILLDLQLSVVDSMDDGKFLITPDSNANVMTFLLKGLLKELPDAKFGVLVPPRDRTTLTEGKSFFNDVIEDSRVTLIPYRYFGNPFIDRMTFDTVGLKEALCCFDVDLVYTNDPTKVLGYKTFFYGKYKKFLPVISRNHWVTGKTDRKVPEEIDFVIRQIEGAIKGYAQTFNSEFGIHLFLENAKEFFNDETIEKLKPKLSAFEAVDIEKVDKYETDAKPKKFTLLWAHRLSYYTGWEEMFDWLKELWAQRQDWQLIVPDPGNKFKQEELVARWPFITAIDKSTWTHAKYLTLCWMSDITLGNHNFPAAWGGLSITEPMAAETVPLMPGKDSYLEMFFPETEDSVYMCNPFFSDKDELLKKINFFMNNEQQLKFMKKEARKFCKQNLSTEKFAKKVAKLITSALSEKV